MTTALETAMKGGKVGDKQAKGALSKAVDKIASLSRRADRTKEAVTEAGAMVVHTAETQGSLFLSSLAEGYFGTDKLKVGGLDLRAPAALLAQGFGLYEAMSGKGGEHALSLGNGIMGSWLASVAVNAGRTLAEKGGRPAAALAAGPVIRGEIGAPVREVLLTPEPGVRGEAEAEARRPLKDRPHPHNRFARARAA